MIEVNPEHVGKYDWSRTCHWARSYPLPNKACLKPATYCGPQGPREKQSTRDWRACPGHVLPGDERLPVEKHWAIR